ncbi:MAG TPA: hypothetical protein ENH02_04785, partial [Bacteroidetes bacterium]|nr:hypothetical protein [Bacteroidota bacterium]
MYIRRHLQEQILKRLKSFPAVCIIGPRQVGKTTLAKQLIPNINTPVHYLDLESAADFNKLENPARMHYNGLTILSEAIPIVTCPALGFLPTAFKPEGFGSC